MILESYFEYNNIEKADIRSNIGVLILELLYTDDALVGFILKFVWSEVFQMWSVIEPIVANQIYGVKGEQNQHSGAIIFIDGGKGRARRRFTPSGGFMEQF